MTDAKFNTLIISVKIKLVNWNYILHFVFLNSLILESYKSKKIVCNNMSNINISMYVLWYMSLLIKGPNNNVTLFLQYPYRHIIANHDKNYIIALQTKTTRIVKLKRSPISIAGQKQNCFLTVKLFFIALKSNYFNSSNFTPNLLKFTRSKVDFL
jgi:hypothetical protein